MTDSYPIDQQNKLRQLAEKADYDRRTVHEILDAGIMVHAAFMQDGQPIVVPMIYGRDGETLFLHGARKARVIKLLKETDSVCMNVTLLDGIVLARSTFNSSMNYRSVTVFGKPELIEGNEQKLQAMKIISENTMPGRWDELRESHEREIKMTGVIAVKIESASAKISSAVPDDDEEDYEIPIWAGVLPLTTRLGTLQSDDRVLAGIEPSAAVQAMQNRKL
ncbi:MAG: pyridoxamine 5'-phosphate oxidase family protein [Gammaproteobacteria bacterium]|nr:pyridoxamine 5'-phosphate oxidase family protein [Gammaproteobacteria bacterium]